MSITTLKIERDRITPLELPFDENIVYKKEGRLLLITLSDYEDFIMLSDEDFQKGFEEAHKQKGKSLDEINWVD